MLQPTETVRGKRKKADSIVNHLLEPGYQEIDVTKYRNDHIVTDIQQNCTLDRGCYPDERQMLTDQRLQTRQLSRSGE